MDSEFEQITCDILADPLFQETRSFLHHGGENSVYDHSVANCARRFFSGATLWAERGGHPVGDTAALLHDFFGYDCTATGSRAISASFRAGSGCATCMRSSTATSPPHGRRSVSA